VFEFSEHLVDEHLINEQRATRVPPVWKLS